MNFNQQVTNSGTKKENPLKLIEFQGIFFLSCGEGGN